MSRVIVYTKEGCHLCERVIAELLKLRSYRSFEISIMDIATDPDVSERYKNIVPVVAIDGKVRLAGATLANPNTLESVLRMALFRTE